MLKTKFLFFVLLIILVSQNSYSQNLPHIAVLEFEGQGISKSEAGPLTDRFRGELVRTNAFVVVSRDKMEAILKEQAFQLSGCTSTECAVEIGQILNIQKIVVGKIGKVAQTYTIDISFIDVETSRIEKSFNRDHKGKTDGILPILKEIAFEMIPPKEGISKIPLYSSGIIAIGSAVVSGFSIYKAQISYENYQDAVFGKDAIKYKDDTEYYDNLALITGITAGVTTIFYFVYNHYYKLSIKPEGFYATPFIQKNQTYGLAINITF